MSLKKLFFLSLWISIGLNSSLVFAKNQVSGKLEKVRQIINITDDLDDDAPILMVTKSEEGETYIDCVCACRDSQWSCTTTECSAQDDKCDVSNYQNEN